MVVVGAIPSKTATRAAEPLVEVTACAHDAPMRNPAIKKALLKHFHVRSVLMCLLPDGGTDRPLPRGVSVWLFQPERCTPNRSETVPIHVPRRFSPYS